MDSGLTDGHYVTRKIGADLPRPLDWIITDVAKYAMCDILAEFGESPL